MSLRGLPEDGLTRGGSGGRQDQIIQGALGNVVDASRIAVILDVAFGVHGFEAHDLFGDAQGQDKEDFIPGGDGEIGAQLLALDRADHAAAQAALDRAEEDGLGSDAVVAAGGLADGGVEEDDDVGGGALALDGTGPIVQVAGPGQAGKDERIGARVGGEDVAQRLAVGGGGGLAGQVDQLAQGFERHGLILVETAVGAVGEDKITKGHGEPPRGK